MDYTHAYSKLTNNSPASTTVGDTYLVSDRISALPPLVGRFAPSPTGRMHAGNIAASLLAWLVAHATGGHCVLRIEDLDASRSRPEYISQLKQDFEALGLSWEGRVLYQSQRQAIYEEAFQSLQASYPVYPCFCTRADLHAAGAPHPGEHQVYSGRCKARSKLEQKELLSTQQAAWRIAVPDTHDTFTDLLQGPQEQSLRQLCGDFVLRRKDGGFAYQLAVVVDDAEQKVSSVTRGCDLLDSVAAQHFLQDALNLPHPTYAHIPLIVDETGARLAKRNRAAHFDELCVTYGSPQAVLGQVAYALGIIEASQPTTPREILSNMHWDNLYQKRELTWASSMKGHI